MEQQTDPEQDDKEFGPAPDKPDPKPRPQNKEGSKQSQTVSADFDNQNDHPLLNKETFKNRRIMAWVALIFMIVMTCICIFYISPDNLSKYDALFGWVYGTISAVILSYMGATTVGYMSFLKNNKSSNGNG